MATLNSTFFSRGKVFRALPQMKKVGRLLGEPQSYNTCEYQGRVFNFAADDRGKFTVEEVFLGEKVGAREVNTGVDCKCNNGYISSCCALDDKILVMAGERNATDFFCAIVSIDPGELTKESIHIEEKKVRGWENYRSGPFLAQISENTVWASFLWSNEIWIGELKGDELVMTKHQDHLPTTDGLGAPPLPLPDGGFLAAGGWPDSTSIVLITLGEHFSFEKVGDMPGEKRYCASIVLIKKRFVVGFGGWKDSYADDMWIFDIQTHRASPVKKEGEWRPGGPWPVLVVRDKEVYVFGGIGASSVCCISFASLSQLIQHGGVRCAFRLCLELPFQPGKGYERSAIIDYAPNYL